MAGAYFFIFFCLTSYRFSATINTINEIEGIENVEPMTHTLDDFVYELREDVAEESVPIDDLLSNCDMHNGREVEVPKVVE